MNDSGAANGGGRFRSDPDPSLRPYVVEYWGFCRDLSGMGEVVITPDCFGELVCCVDDLYELRDGQRLKLPRCFLVGLLGGPLRIESGGVVRCMAARLRAGALGRILPDDRRGPTQGWRDARSLFGRWRARLSRLIGRCDWQSCVRLFDELLLGIYGAPGVGEPPDLAQRFVGPARPPTADVANERGVTRRQVERRVRRLTRTSPKRLACLARFQQVRDAIWADPSTDLAGLAAAAGYSDQAHMTREFKRFSGQTPGAFIHSTSAKRRKLISSEVAFVQEPPRGGR